MDHKEAIENEATERYLLDEMSVGERDAFEDHFFDCSECAEDVRDGAKMMAAGREVAQEGATVHPIRPQRGWTGWFPQAAAAAIVSGTFGWFMALQTVAPHAAAVTPSMSFIEQVDVDMGENRGPAEAPQTIRIPEGEAGSLNFIITPHDEATSYVIDVRDAAGKVVLTQPVSLDRAAKPFSLELRALPRGRYEVVTEGVRKDGNRLPVTRVPLEVAGESRGVH